jgi:hypothetical protein
MICALCVSQLRPEAAKAGFARWPPRFGALLLGLTLAWFFFYLAGQWLLSAPSEFHEGALWRPAWWDEP